MAKEAVQTNTNTAGKLTKNFRNSADIENFYRFIHENDLREEARQVLELVNNVLNPKKPTRGRKKKTVQ